MIVVGMDISSNYSSRPIPFISSLFFLQYLDNFLKWVATCMLFLIVDLRCPQYIIHFCIGMCQLKGGGGGWKYPSLLKGQLRFLLDILSLVSEWSQG